MKKILFTLCLTWLSASAFAADWKDYTMCSPGEKPVATKDGAFQATVYNTTKSTNTDETAHKVDAGVGVEVPIPFATVKGEGAYNYNNTKTEETIKNDGATTTINYDCVPREVKPRPTK